MDRIREFFEQYGIDSVQKLNLLLYLQRHPSKRGSIDAVGRWLHCADMPLLELLIGNLATVGLITVREGQYGLTTEATSRLLLEEVAAAYEHPLTRQTILDKLQPTTGRLHLECAHCELGTQSLSTTCRIRSQPCPER